MKRKLGFMMMIVVFAGMIFLAVGLREDRQNDKSRATARMVGPEPAQRRLSGSLAPAEGFENLLGVDPDRSFQSQIAYFETLLSYGRNRDPRNSFILVNAYLNTSQQAYGIAFFERILHRYGDRMGKQARAHYLSAYAILRATYADKISLFGRIGWVKDTFRLLEEAADLTEGEDPMVHWSAGLVYAQVPFFFNKKRAAYRELNWLAERPETEPLSGFYREVYYHLSQLHAGDGNDEEAQRFLKKSGYGAYRPKAMFMGWFSTDPQLGTSMSASRVIEEVVPGRVFSLYGFGFSDIHFLVSDDGLQLIAVDAGTSPIVMRQAYTLLKERTADLPPLTTLLVTHAHWDHIGGYRYLKSLNPDLKIYGRENYQGTLQRSQRDHSYQYFRGAGFDHAWIRDYRPDHNVDQPLTLKIGGTAIQLIPISGGETEDALFVFVPKLETMFVGDFMMPYYGEPWVEEGLVMDAVSGMDQVLTRHPKHVIHGHHPLTTLYTTAKIRIFRDHQQWLVEQVKAYVYKGYSVQEIIKLNLIPPGLELYPEAYASFLSPRDHLIGRIVDNLVGIWRENSTGQDPEGLDTLTTAEYGRLLENYLHLSPKKVRRALRGMIDGGDIELALKMSVAALNRYPGDQGLLALKEEAADRLRGLHQFLDPFKFTVYAEMVGKNLEHIPK